MIRYYNYVSALLTTLASISLYSMTPGELEKQDFFRAIALGKNEIVHKLLASGISANKKCDTTHKTALHAAAEHGNEVLIKALLKHGADINACDKWNRTPLYVAAENNHKGSVKELLKQGADVNAHADICGKTKDHSALEASLNASVSKDITKDLALYGGAYRTYYEIRNTFEHICFKDQKLAQTLFCYDYFDPKDWQTYKISPEELTAVVICPAAKGHPPTLQHILALFNDQSVALEHAKRSAFKIAAMRGRFSVVKFLWENSIKNQEKTIRKTCTLLQNLLKYASLDPIEKRDYNHIMGFLFAHSLPTLIPEKTYLHTLPKELRTMVFEYYAGKHLPHIEKL